MLGLNGACCSHIYLSLKRDSKDIAITTKGNIGMWYEAEKVLDRKGVHAFEVNWDSSCDVKFTLETLFFLQTWHLATTSLMFISTLTAN